MLAAAGLAVAACGSVKMGAAALVGNSRISSASLAGQVANLSAAYRADTHKGTKPQRTESQKPQQVLTWMLLFRIYDRLAERHGIEVTPAQVQHQLAGLAKEAKQSGLSTDEYVSAAGALPPDLVPDLGRYFAIVTAFEGRLDGGKAPTGSARQKALEARVSHAACLAAKSLDIQVNPQFGRFDYTSYSVVTAPYTLAAEPSASASPSSAVRTTPPC
jgi:hypothetical protein